MILQKKLFTVKVLFEFIRCSPHLGLFFFHRNRALIKADVIRWMDVFGLIYNPTIGFLFLLSFFPEFRNLFYVRIGLWKHLLNIVCPQMPTLYIYTKNIGGGLFIQHGFATVIAAKSIGDNCWINQQVTIGFSNKDDAPYLGDNVTVNAGAKVIGNITVGSNSKIGANAVVVKNVPDNCTVVGIPAYIVKRDGLKVKESL